MIICRFEAAILEASGKRLRPIIMTALTTAMGAIPLIYSSGAGAETRLVIGTVILAGVMLATLLTLFVVPMMVKWWAKRSGSPKRTGRMLEAQLVQHEGQV